jgi:endonuclease/exonuclease/phosphatase family metal-dependent hydrolase
MKNRCYRHWIATGRRYAAETLAARLRDLTGPLALVGDFNAEWDAAELRPLRELGLQRPQSGRPTYPTSAPDREIDFILVRGVQVMSYIVDTSAKMSDHYPVIADLQL